LVNFDLYHINIHQYQTDNTIFSSYTSNRWKILVLSILSSIRQTNKQKANINLSTARRA
jgi:hypothetical protein